MESFSEKAAFNANNASSSSYPPPPFLPPSPSPPPSPYPPPPFASPSFQDKDALPVYPGPSSSPPEEVKTAPPSPPPSSSLPPPFPSNPSLPPPVLPSPPPPLSPAAITFNILWFLIGGGLPSLMLYFFLSFFLAATIIGLPIAIDLLRAGVYSAFPYGFEAKTESKCGCKRFWVQVFWFPFGLVLYFFHLSFGILWLLSLVGIPFGLQHIALAKLSFYPLGLRVERRRMGAEEFFSFDYYFGRREETAKRQLADV